MRTGRRPSARYAWYAFSLLGCRLCTILATLAFVIPSAAKAQAPDSQPEQTVVVPLFAPPGMESGREAASLVVGAIVANFWLDGDVVLEDAAHEYFAAKTDPLRPDQDSRLLALADLMRDKPISVPLYVRLIQEKRRPPRLGFAWQDEEVAPPHALTFRASMDRQCFTLSIPLHWERLIDAPLELPEGTAPNERSELRLNIVAVPADVYAIPVASDARQVFGVRCQSHTVINATPIAGAVLTVGGVFLTNLDPDFL